MNSKYTRSVILPCAGTGSRLNLPYPKEIHGVIEGKSMIDFTIERLKHLSKKPLIIVIINENKLSLQKYLLKKWSNFEFLFLFQKGIEFLGAINDSLPYTLENNLILLPDQVIKESGVIERTFVALERGALTSIIGYKRNNFDKLHDEGVFKSNKDTLTELAEKPGIYKEVNYESIWCGLGFKGSISGDFLNALQNLYKKKVLLKNDLKNTPLYNSPIFYVEEYIDLGTWERLNNFLKKQL